ncbi:hypothetical protein FACS1894180_0730 [Bacteroidia bacterium]|nr:hypothetical protein FACS1894180_0730 [Bacteroidia bacterium]
MENNCQLFVQKEKIEVVFSDNVNADIFVYDVYGKLCYNKNDIFDRKMMIPTSAFSDGIYIVNIVNRQTHQTISKKVVIR